MSRVSKGSVHTSVAKPAPPPKIAVTAMANTTNVTTTSAILSTQATDIHGTSKIKYRWTVTSAPAGAPSPVFTANASNAARTTTVNFRMAGTYQFNVTATDPTGLKASSTVGVVVSPTVSRMVVIPVSSAIVSGGGVSLMAIELDQFGLPLAHPPLVTWSATAGSISPTGNYAAPWFGGPQVVTAASGGVSASTTIQVVNQPPTILSTSVNAGPTNSSLNLSAVAVDDGGPANLSYVWEVLASPVGAPAPIFSTNVSNRASSTTAWFGMSGAYTLAVIADDSGGLAAAKALSVTVSPVTTSIAVSPATAALSSGQTEQLTADVKDQFGHDLTPQPALTWSTSAGTITQAGLFTAPQTGGSVTITAAAGATSGTASVSVTNPGPTIVQPAWITSQNNAAGSAYLRLTASDPAGDSNLSYSWTTTAAPPGIAAPSLTNDPYNVGQVIAQFHEAGQYTFMVTVTDSGGLSVTSSVNVSVAQVATQVVVTPGTVSLAQGATQQFSAVLEDQFGAAMKSQPTFTWSASTGTITQAGLYAAPQTGGSATITVAASSLSTTANVSIAGPAIDQPASVTYQNDAYRYADLYVIASGPAGSSGLTCTWTTTAAPAGASAPTFYTLNSDGSETQVTFNAAGQYTFLVTVTDAAGLSATSSVNVSVAQVPQIAVTPNLVFVPEVGTQQFSAVFQDQFGTAIPSQPVSTWSATAGTITSSGLYTSSGVFGWVTITATAGTLSGTALVGISHEPWIVNPASASPAVVTGTSTVLSVLGDQPGGQDGGAGNLDYDWGVDAMPHDAPFPSFSVNNYNGAATTTVTVYEAGTYRFVVTVMGYVSGTWLSTPSYVTVTVDQTLTSVAVSPGPVGLAAGQSQALTATAFDQFGQQMATQPAFTWSTTAGSVSSSGLFTAPSNLTIATVTASAGSVAGQTKVYPTSALPTVASPAAAGSGWVIGTSTTLSVLGADSAGASGLSYTWATTSAPAGVASPTFSVDGTNAAHNTTVTFAGPGSYTFTATITDALGLSMTSSVNVLVSATRTSIDLTPGPIDIGPGQSRSFSATGLDQFGALLSPQPSFTWSATAGSISAAGVFTAPGSFGAATVKAGSGAVTGSAVVTVMNLTLNDPGIRNLVQTFASSGIINRTDMIQLLQLAADEYSTVTQTELTDLQSIVADATLFNMPDSVRVLASDVVDGNVANAHYQGQTLGNLAAGSSSVQVNDLIDKWFLGTDHPAASSGISGVNLTYVSFAGSLFNGTPSYTDMQQGAVGDCYFIAGLGALANTHTNVIQNMFQDNGDGTWTVRFYDQGVADYVTVDRYLPAIESGSLYNTWYAKVGPWSTATSINSANVLWVAMAEKAYAQWNETGKEAEWTEPGYSFMRDGTNSYTDSSGDSGGIAGGYPGTVFEQITGETSIIQYGASYVTEQQLIDALAAHDAVAACTVNIPLGDVVGGLVGDHGYTVVGYDAATDTFQLCNPWGVDNTPPPPLTFGQLITYTGYLDIADASSTYPLDGSPSPAFALGGTGAGVGQAVGPSVGSAATIDSVFAWDTPPSTTADWWRDAMPTTTRHSRRMGEVAATTAGLGDLPRALPWAGMFCSFGATKTSA